MRTRIISAFPGTGKSFYHKSDPFNTIDSDSSNFSWVVEDGEKKRNPDFPSNYIKHIKENIGKYEYIFVSSHKEVRDALLNDCVFFYLLYPDLTSKDAYLERYKERGSPEGFINLISNNWDDWINECQGVRAGCVNINISGHSMEEVLASIKKEEDEFVI